MPIDLTKVSDATPENSRPREGLIVSRLWSYSVPPWYAEAQWPCPHQLENWSSVGQSVTAAAALCKRPPMPLSTIGEPFYEIPTTHPLRCDS
jgi:hypothetical protein